MASQYLARLGIVLGIDSGELVQGITDAQKQFHNFKNQVEKDTKAAAREFETLKNATEDYGKTLTKVEQIQREIDRGRFMFASQNVKDKLLDQAKAYDAQAASMKKVAGAMTDQQKMQVTYQVTDFFTQIASGQNAMIAFIQQGGQLKDSMGGVGAAMRAVVSIFTPFKVAVGGIAAYFVTMAYAAYQASEDIDKFNKSIALTGDYSGVTLEKFRGLSKEMAQASGTSIKDAKDALLGLMDSGKFTEQSIDAAQRAVLTYARVAGVSGAEAAKALAGALSGSASEAKALNDKMNFLTLEQYKNIESLEKLGKTQEAAREISIALTTKLEQQAKGVGMLQEKWKNLTKTFSDWWEGTKDALSGPTIEQNIEALTKQIDALNESMMQHTLFNALFKDGNFKNLQALKDQKEALLEIVRLRSRSATAKDVGNAKSEISMWDKAGGAAGFQKIAEEVEKARTDARFKAMMASASEEQQIELELARKIEQAKNEERKKNEDTFGQYAAQTAKLRIEKIAEAEAEAEKKRIDLRKKRFNQELDAEIAARRNAEEKQTQEDLRKEQAKLEAYKTTEAAKEQEKYQSDILRMQMEMIGASEKEKSISQEKLRIEKEIADWKRSEQYSLLSESDRTFYEEQKRQVSEAKIQNIELADSLKYVQNMYDAVWGNMSSAIEQFVRTGKLSIKDLTKSIIQDMLIMQMKLQAMTLIRGLLGSFFASYGANGASGLGTGVTGFGSAYAEGGNPTPNTINLVGENGPELFIPRTAGTIIPNHALSGMGGTTNVTNNYINAIDAKSFEQRLLESNQTIWSANQYAAKNLSTNFGRT